MNRKCCVAFLMISVLAFSSNSFSQETLSKSSSPYLGQKPPGLTPEVFAPNLVSSEHKDWTGHFTPDMKAYYFTRLSENKASKFVITSEHNGWKVSKLSPPLGGTISPDGKVMHSGNKYRERTDDGWSELKSLGPMFEAIQIMVLSASTNGTYVFDERTEIGTIRYSRLIDGTREAPKAFHKKINTGKWTAHPFIAADESYIIWDSEREDGYGDSDLYISFQQQDGSWGAGINLGSEINTTGPDTGGVVSPDGKYLFFNRKVSEHDTDVYWVDTQIFETLRPKSSPLK
ncbi:PD40 domain-containing protein [Pseudoalteromonas sp. T1lg23B]|uniref:PD40 domain-containing protein n=1 Tax=Pseudoalteromonas sp. T1lg23B TaxID=2077097 RepID=UPI000CF70476|nr:PD40 domain-containing protein [Pseudoalteromonas sp. T1lg23B]